MRIKFSLLWFEDQTEWAEGKIPDVKAIIEDHGFGFVDPKLCRKQEEFDGDYDDYDMILVDYQLVDGARAGKTGGDIINRVRRDGSFTTILFYSQNGEADLRTAIARNNLDGVFCAHRGDFLHVFEKLFKATIKKMEDVNNLRGLVMAETADLESLKEEIINLYDLVECIKKKEITNKTLESLTKMKADLEGFLQGKTEDTPFKELLEGLDFSKKSRTVHRINERAMPVVSQDFVYATFEAEVIRKRNLLAHVKETIDASTGQRVLKSEKNGQILIFSHDEAMKIRKDLLKYKLELEKIKASLSQAAGKQAPAAPAPLPPTP